MSWHREERQPGRNSHDRGPWSAKIAQDVHLIGQWGRLSGAMRCSLGRTIAWIFIEHAIGGMKRYNILVHTFRNRIEHFEDDVIGVCAGLWNLVLSY